jgi:hypothetical protein
LKGNMKQRLTPRLIGSLPAPAEGNKVYWDSGSTPGFGLRITAAGHRAFILNYRNRAGRARRLTIGDFPTWSLGAARGEAAELRREIDAGGDPLADLKAGREAPTVATLADRFIADELPKRRETTRID